MHLFHKKVHGPLDFIKDLALVLNEFHSRCLKTSSSRKFSGFVAWTLPSLNSGIVPTLKAFMREKKYLAFYFLLEASLLVMT